MTQVFPDFTEAMDFGPGPEGVFEARIVYVDTWTADTESHTPMLEVRYEVFGSEAEQKKVAKRQLTRNYPLRGKGTGFLKTFLKAVRIPPDQFGDTTQLLNKVVLISTTNEKFQGEDTWRVNKVMPHPQAA